MDNPDVDILDTKKSYSKVLKGIDARIKFKHEEDEYLENMKKEYFLKKREKELKFIKNQQHENIVRSLKKIEEETKKNIDNKFNKVNVSQAINRIISLPKMSKYKKNMQDNKKKDEFNIIRFENVWKEQYMDDVKNNKKDKNSKLIFDGFYYNDIFDKNYDRYRKRLEESKDKNIRLEKIKSNNLKVSNKLKIHRFITLKAQDHREYRPNYSVIEKHKPVVKLDSKSTRLFLKNINPMTIPNIKTFKSRNNKSRRNALKNTLLSGLSFLKNKINAKTFLSNSQVNIIDSNKYNKNNKRISMSALNLKSKNIKSGNTGTKNNKSHFNSQRNIKK